MTPENWAPTVQVDDQGNTIEIANASTDDLRRAHAYHCEVADRLRLDAAMRPKRDATSEAWIEKAQQHRRVAVRVYEAIADRGERLTD
jgi:hypothetical protein